MVRALGKNGDAKSSSPLIPRTLGELLDIPVAQLDRVDIGRMNLLCAEGLPGSEELNISRCLNLLDRWTDSVRKYTNDCESDFRQNPSKFGNHKGQFSFMAMVCILKHPKGIGVAYQPTAIGNIVFSDSRDDFIHGLLMRRLGTCASLPVLFTAIGRRLDYPMHLALTLGHFICQWVDDRGRLNLEGACGGGGQVVPDSHYLNAPVPMTLAQINSGRFFRPLSPEKCLAHFLQTRGHCFRDTGSPSAAVKAYLLASEVAPGWTRPDRTIAAMQFRGPRPPTHCTYSPPAVFTGQIRDRRLCVAATSRRMDLRVGLFGGPALVENHFRSHYV